MYHCAFNSECGVWHTCVATLATHPVHVQYTYTRRSGRYAPILLAPAEGWGALRALLGAFETSLVGEGSKQNILNVVSK